VRRNDEASSNGRTADFGSAYEGSNPSASANSGPRPGSARAELKALARPSHVLLVPLGEVSPKLVAEAAQALRDVLGVAAKNGPSLDRPRYAFNEARGQYHATSILRRLASLRTGGSGPVQVVGITDVDLFLPDAPYVIGDADRDAGAALFSLARLSHGTPAEVRRRAQVETVHGTGHLLGLSHCADYRCAMFVSRDAADSDRKGPGLCASCRAALGAEE
jgi:archaemetzincin